MRIFSLEDLQRQILHTGMALKATGINRTITDQLMAITDDLLENQRDLDRLLEPLRNGLAEIHEILQEKELPPWIDPKAVQREVRTLARMLRWRNLSNMQVEFDCLIHMDVAFKHIPVVTREIARAFTRIDNALDTQRLRSFPAKEKGENTSRKVASKKTPKKRTYPMRKLG